MQDAVIVRKVMSRNAEIQECRRQVQYWTDRLQKLEAERRRETLLTQFEVDPDGAWECLTALERQDKSYIIAALRNNAEIAGHYLYREWSNIRIDDDPVIPEHLLADRDVVLAYTAAEEFCSDFFFNCRFEVPENLRDDKEVMLAVCSKISKTLELASSRLQDDCDVVLAALCEGTAYSSTVLEFASHRLRKDKEVILTAVENHNVDWNISFDWLGSALLHQMTASEEKEVALAVLKRVSEDGENNRTSDCGFEHFSESIRDNKELALMFVQNNGELLRWCSYRLKQDREIVKAAVAQSPGAVDYSQGKIREELTSDSSFMLTAIKLGFVSLLPLALPPIRNDASIVLEALANGLVFNNVPAHMKADPTILLKAFQHGAIEIDELPKELRTKKSFFLEAVKANSDIYRLLPEFLQKDEEIALEAVKREALGGTKFYTAASVFANVPSLLNSREAMMAATKSSFHPEGYFLNIVMECPFLDDREFMLAACRQCVDAVELASDRLRNDQNFLLALLPEVPAGIRYASHEFQLNNIDVILKAVETTWLQDKYKLFMDLAPDVWNHRDVLMAYLKKGISPLKFLSRDSGFLDDHELVRLAVKADYSEFRYASATLKADRDFVLSLMEIDGRALEYAARELKYDNDILVAAIAKHIMTIDACFSDNNTDFDFLVSFASKVRSKLKVHEVFVSDILRGIAIVEPHVAPAHRCHLPLLDRGSETSIGFKRLIAEYVGAPLGKELEMLRKVSSSLIKFGY